MTSFYVLFPLSQEDGVVTGSLSHRADLLFCVTPLVSNGQQNVFVTFRCI